MFPDSLQFLNVRTWVKIYINWMKLNWKFCRQAGMQFLVVWSQKARSALVWSWVAPISHKLTNDKGEHSNNHARARIWYLIALNFGKYYCNDYFFGQEQCGEGFDKKQKEISVCFPPFVYFGVCERQETKLEFSVSRSVDESHCVLDTSIPLGW